MIIGTFIFYFILFIFTFSYPGLRKKDKQSMAFEFFAIPALLAAVMVFLTVIKVYFIYKLLVLLFIIVTFLLSYWQWGDQIHCWWK